jgi:hypothetical protein
MSWILYFYTSTQIAASGNTAIGDDGRRADRAAHRNARTSWGRPASPADPSERRTREECAVPGRGRVVFGSGADDGVRRGPALPEYIRVRGRGVTEDQEGEIQPKPKAVTKKRAGTSEPLTDDDDIAEVEIETPKAKKPKMQPKPKAMKKKRAGTSGPSEPLSDEDDMAEVEMPEMQSRKTTMVWESEDENGDDTVFTEPAKKRPKGLVKITSQEAKISDFLLIEVPCKGGGWKKFIGMVDSIQGTSSGDNSSLHVLFLNKLSGSTKFVFPDNEDPSFVYPHQILGRVDMQPDRRRSMYEAVGLDVRDVY